MRRATTKLDRRKYAELREIEASRLREVRNLSVQTITVSATHPAPSQPFPGRENLRRWHLMETLQMEQGKSTFPPSRPPPQQAREKYASLAR